MLRVMLLVMSGLFLTGCTQLTLFSFGRRAQLREASLQHPVVEIICLWEPAEGQGMDGLPTRGFAGQILFFTVGQPQPLQVNGDVRVYVFDDHGDAEEQSRPIHQFDFSPEAWQAYRRDTNIGTAYQLFIPYTRKTSYQSNCSIRVRYMPKDGGSTVYSKMAPVSLPGRSRPDQSTLSTRTLPEGNSARAPVGAPAPTESAPELLMRSMSTSDMTTRLLKLQTAAADAARSLSEQTDGDGLHSPETPTGAAHLIDGHYRDVHGVQ